MILLIDNYDSFVYNLARYTRELGYQCLVKRNNEITVDEVKILAPSHIIISPGPCAPAQAGICVQLIQTLHKYVPILGVCLGHQAIGEAFGGHIVRAQVPMHGKGRLIHHDGQSIFEGIPNPMLVARYHSLIIERASCPDILSITATCPESGAIMAVQHQDSPTYGVQFHPESVLTKHGMTLLRQFLSLSLPIRSSAL